LGENKIKMEAGSGKKEKVRFYGGSAQGVEESASGTQTEEVV
jgi:hypothetical protein